MTGKKVPYRFGPRREGDPPLLVADSTRLRQALGWTALWIALAAGFAVLLYFHGHLMTGDPAHANRQLSLEFVTGYLVEEALSVDNLFIFLVIFQGFRISPQRQHKALMWGVVGAVVLRVLFIAAGIALLRRFDWITWCFGLILFYAAWRLVRGGSAKAAIPEWIVKLQPARGSLLPVILAVEVTDVLFATDSIPAVLAISHNPFVVYTSNIAAVLGLRSLYFALASLLDRFRYLHYGLAALLAFVALKMLAARWIAVPITISLVVMGRNELVKSVFPTLKRGANKLCASGAFVPWTSGAFAFCFYSSFLRTFLNQSFSKRVFPVPSSPTTPQTRLFHCYERLSASEKFRRRVWESRCGSERRGSQCGRELSEE